MESESINLVGEQMCEECDAFLGKPHKDTCSKKGRLVEMADATEKFTTVEHAQQENPILGIDQETAGLILRSMLPAEPEIVGEDAEKLKALRVGLEAFVGGSLNV
jgi:hypothetical protein